MRPRQLPSANMHKLKREAMRQLQRPRNSGPHKLRGKTFHPPRRLSWPLARERGHRSSYLSCVIVVERWRHSDIEFNLRVCFDAKVTQLKSESSPHSAAKGKKGGREREKRRERENEREMAVAKEGRRRNRAHVSTHEGMLRQSTV